MSYNTTNLKWIILCSAIVVFNFSFAFNSDVEDLSKHWYGDNYHTLKKNAEVLINDKNSTSEETLYGYYFLGKYYTAKENLDSAIYFYNLVLEQNKFFTNDTMPFKTYLSLAFAYDQNENFEIAEQFYKNAIQEYSESIHKIDDIDAAWSNLGYVYATKGKKLKAFQSYMQSLKIAEKLKDNNKLESIYIELGNWYYYFADKNEAKKYYLKAQKSIKKESYNQFLINYNLGAIAFQNRNYDESLISFIKALNFALKNKDSESISDINSSIAMIKCKQGKFREAKKYFNRGFYLADSLKSENLKISLLSNYGYYLVQNNRIYEAIDSLNEGLALTERLNETLFKHAFYKQLSEAYQKINYNGKALNFNNRYLAFYRDTLFKEEQERAIINSKIKYETEKTEQENLALKQKTEIDELKISRKNTQLISLLGFLSLLTIAGLLGYKNQQSKQKILAQEKKSLQQEMIIASTNALIDGRETERKRLASQLHDSLGAILAAAKIHFSSTKKYIEENKYNTVDKLINDAANEARNIAHNILPPTLLKFGLYGAVQELAEKISTQHLNFVVVKNEDENLDSSLISIKDENKKISLYRILQELLNNVIKHANASECIINFKTENNVLNISIADNGKGIDLKKDKATWGIGLTNIESRIKYFKGNFNIDSEVNKGTVVNITVAI